MPNVRLGRHARRWITVGVIVVVLASGGATAWAMTGPSGPAYRTATVTRANVTQTLLATGTIEPVSQANVSFPVSGQVASVSVGLGLHVTAGEVLARLSTTALASQVSSDQAAVATATVRLAADEASETTATAYITTTTAYITSDPGGGGGTGGSGGSGGKNPIAGELRAIARDQVALLAAQHRLDGALAEAKSLLAVETSLCTVTSTPPPTPTPTPTPTTSPTGPTSPTPTPSPSTPRSSPTPTPSPSTPRNSPTPTPSPSTPRSSPSPTWTESPTPSYSATPSHSATPSASTTATTATLTAYLAPPPHGGPPGGPTPKTCQAAITELMSVQSGIAVDEQSLANSESALTKLLSEVAAAVEKSAGSGGTGGTGGSGGTGGTGGGGIGGSGGSGSGGSGGSGAGGRGGVSGGGASGATTGPATAAQLAADQASLDSANAELSVARQNLAAATLAAPISGTVALVNVAPGQQVTGSQATSTSADFVIEGAGGEEATTTVSVSDVGEIRVGQPATITLDGSATPINGQVVAIGILSSTSSTGSASYPVTIGLAAGSPALFAGSDAQVAITLAKVSDAVTVPTSAVEGTGAAAFVTVLEAGKPVGVRVVVGASGPVLTQVTSGLTVGEQVVLADMSTPLPTNTNPFAARGLTTGGGGFGGGRTGTGTGTTGRG